MIRVSMTLPELVSAADRYIAGELVLTAEEKRYLIQLLESYAQEVLNPGQCLQVGGVSFAKTVAGHASVEFDGET